MIVLADVFPKLQTVKNFLRTLSKKRRLRTRIDSQHVKASQMLGISMRVLLSCFFIILMDVDLENFSPSVRLNLRGVC